MIDAITNPQQPQQLTILGATGSIGQSTLAVVKAHPERFQLYALTAHQQVDAMALLCLEYQPQYAVMVDAKAAAELQRYCQQHRLSTQVLAGAESLLEVAQAAAVEVVMAAIVGAAGLAPTLAAVNAGKRVLLANKEALVMSGQLFMDAVARSGAQLLPVDSEHNAIFQCLPPTHQQALGQHALASAGIDHIILTGSGGPFRELELAQLAVQTPAAACAHPNWSMGQKISVDSATMLNKGLEYIEARWLFNCRESELQVVIHPQSVIHSMVQYNDGSVLAQLGQPDMRTPIASCLAYPQRLSSGVEPLNFTQISALTFAEPCAERYPCLWLAQQACWEGQWATTSLNAANEVAVAAFLAGKISFTEIAATCAEVLAKMPGQAVNEIADVLSLDEHARALAHEWIGRH